jgi:hypothetical protein
VSASAATHVIHDGALHQLLRDPDGTTLVLAPARTEIEISAGDLAPGRLLQLPSDRADLLAFLPHDVTAEARAAMGPWRRGAAAHRETPAEVLLPGGRRARKHVLLCGGLRPVYEAALEQFVSVEAAGPGGKVGARVQWLSRMVDLACEEVYLCFDDAI